MATDVAIHENNAPDAVMAGFEGSAIEASLLPTQVGAISAAAREEAELKAAIVVAKRFPRDEAASYTRIIKSCGRPGFAEGALYRFPRGGQQIEGPSVNLAREMARCWGNIRYGLRIVSLDDEQVHIKGYALDLETNNYVEMEDRFAKLIQRKNKRTGQTDWVEPDERDLRELVNRRGAILVRNAILQVLPPDVTEDAGTATKATLRKAAEGDIGQSREDAVRRLAIGFDGIGVTAAMLASYLKHELAIISPEELADLRKVYRSILDGHTTRGDHFDMGNGSGSTEAAKDVTEKLRTAAKKKAESDQGEIV
jgi:hypothetical protein